MKNNQPWCRFFTFRGILLAHWMIGILFFMAGTSRSDETMVYPVPPVSGGEAKSPDQKLEFLSQVGRGHYVPLKLRGYTEDRELNFRTGFEECAPGRNSAANEWSAFGAPGGNKDINCMGREMWVRYPLFDVAFRIYQNGAEIRPDTLDSFRLGLVNNRLPAIWGSWQHEGLSYKISVMTVPGEQYGNFDLYKLEIQNPTDKPLTSKLVAGIDGPPDMRLEDGVVHGQGDAPFVIADAPAETELVLRDYGLCDKRAMQSDRSFRLGLDGVPVVYRFKAQPGKKYLVYLTAPINVAMAGYYIQDPKDIGDQVFEYQVEGCPPQTIDSIQYRQDNKKLNQPARPLFARFEGAQDQNGDGYIEVRSGVTANSKCRHTVLGTFYVFPEGTKIESDQSMYGGEMVSQCVWRVTVGIKPELKDKNEGYYNSKYFDYGDACLARLKLDYTRPVAPGETQTFWLKIPPIHRREPTGRGLAHAFRETLPGEAIPPFGKEKVEALKKLDPRSAEQMTVKCWDAFFARAARYDLPDPILTDIFLSRLATREILDIKINDKVWFNACSPFGYFDHSYRDACYHVIGRDMAGMHQESRRLLNAYCMDVKDIKERGPICYRGEPLQLGMLEDGVWLTRFKEWDNQGQNIWALVEHYKLTGDREWLEKTAYPYIRRGAIWIVNSRHKHMKEVGDPSDPRYGLIEPGAMDIGGNTPGVHMYYMDAFAVLGLKETADAAAALNNTEDAKMFHQEYLDLKNSLYRSFQKTFKRTGLYEGFIWYGTETEKEAEALGGGMYGDYGYPLVWPCDVIDPHDPMWTASLRYLDYQAQTSGAGMHPGLPYFGVDRAISYIRRGEPDKTLDYFCSYTDTAGGTFCWGEGYYNKNGAFTCGDQPHNWADSYWLILFRNLFAFEDGNNLLITPATFHRWMQGDKPIIANGLPTYFGVLDLTVQPSTDGRTIDYTFSISPRGDQDKRKLEKIILSPRTATGCAIESVQVDGKKLESFTRDQIILAKPARNRTIKVHVDITNL